MAQGLTLYYGHIVNEFRSKILLHPIVSVKVLEDITLILLYNIR
jgi:hypothetical protein